MKCITLSAVLMLVPSCSGASLTPVDYADAVSTHVALSTVAGAVEGNPAIAWSGDAAPILTQATFLEAMGRHRKANVRNEGGEERLPAILQGKSIKPFISSELIEKSQPVQFQLPSGGTASGYRAEILPENGAGQPCDATDRLIDATRRECVENILALIEKEPEA